jgi:hypothetical protein
MPRFLWKAAWMGAAPKSLVGRFKNVVMRVASAGFPFSTRQSRTKPDSPLVRKTLWPNSGPRPPLMMMSVCVSKMDNSFSDAGTTSPRSTRRSV